MATYGPKPRWGDRSPCTIYWPADHRVLYEKEAAAAGLSLNEWIIRTVARTQGITAPADDQEPRPGMSA